MKIELVDANEVSVGRGGRRGTGRRYTKYEEAVKPHLDFLLKSIDESPDGVIRVKTADMAEAIGMKGKSSTAIYWGLRYVLFHHGIAVSTGKTVGSGEPVLIMRRKGPEDRLPDSLLAKAGEAIEAIEAEAEISEEEEAEAEA